MELAFGTGVTSLATMCGALSTACRHLQEEGIPRSSVLHGFRVVEDICVDVLRGLSVRTTHIEQEHQGYQGHGARVSVGETKKVEDACRQRKRDGTRSPVSVPMLAHLAAGLQHCAGCEHAAFTDQEKVSIIALLTPCGMIHGFGQRGFLRCQAVGTCWTLIQVCADAINNSRRHFTTLKGVEHIQPCRMPCS